MPHPALGLPPTTTDAGRAAAAARLRRAADRLPALALDAALRIDPSLRHRYDDLQLRRFVRDYDGHLDQLVRAVSSDDDALLATYGESLVPIYRRRGVRMNDVVSLVRGLEEAAVAVSQAVEADAIRRPVAAWIERLRHHRRLAGDHVGNSLARFIWKGAGLGDDTVV